MQWNSGPELVHSPTLSSLRSSYSSLARQKHQVGLQLFPSTSPRLVANDQINMILYNSVLINTNRRLCLAKSVRAQRRRFALFPSTFSAFLFEDCCCFVISWNHCVSSAIIGLISLFVFALARKLIVTARLWPIFESGLNWDFTDPTHPA